MMTVRVMISDMITVRYLRIVARVRISVRITAWSEHWFGEDNG